VCRLVGQSVRKVYCAKTTDWIQMPFGMVNGVSQGMGALDGCGDRQMGRGIFGVNLGHPILTNGDFVA